MIEKDKNMSVLVKWVLGFITVWVMILVCMPKVISIFENRVNNSALVEQQIQQNRKLSISLEEYKSKERFMISLLEYHKIIDQKEALEMKAQVED